MLNLIYRYGSLPIILDGILNNLLDPDDDLKKMTDMIKQETENNVQVFEILETNSSDKFSKNNKIAALLNKSNMKVLELLRQIRPNISSAISV